MSSTTLIRSLFGSRYAPSISSPSFLYNSRPRDVRTPKYHHPTCVYVKTEDPDLPAFYFDPVVNPISAHASGGNGSKKEDDEWDVELALPDDFEPILSNTELFNEHTASAIALYWAPRPFNMRSGHMRRSVDVPLVNAWFMEHCPPAHPVKVRVSYQKLLKCYVLNCLHARPPKGLKRKYLFPTLRNTKFFQATQLIG